MFRKVRERQPSGGSGIGAGYYLCLTVFPLLEAGSFALAVALWDQSVLAASLCLILAALGLNYSIHISFHEMMHQRIFKSRVLDGILRLINSLWMGVPFDGYCLHHENHHRYNNSIEDYSTTWREGPDGPVPQHWLLYSLSWPVHVARALRVTRIEETAGRVTNRMRWNKREKAFLLIAWMLFGWYSPTLLGMYILVTYLGWTLSAVHNFGQHPPIDLGAHETTSVYSPTFNLLFMNNGLHREHHQNPGKRWSHLVPQPDADSRWTIPRPHLFQPLLGPSLTGGGPGLRP